MVSQSTPDQLEPISDVIPICKADFQRAIRKEHARTPTDVLARRCRLAMVDLAEAQRITPLIQAELTDDKLAKSKINLEN